VAGLQSCIDDDEKRLADITAVPRELYESPREFHLG
jgi:hypothetical protein